MAGPGIEVERKFKVGADGLAGLQGRIAAAGGALVRRLAFTDAYHDTPDHRLTLEDVWLRQRDTVWELKIPTGHVGGTAVYTEVTGETAVIEWLRARLEPDGDGAGGSGGGGGGMPAVLEAYGLASFAVLETSRESYAFQQGASAECACTVDVDHCPTSNYAVGEIELLCTSQEEVAPAVAAIELLGQRLGVEM